MKNILGKIWLICLLQSAGFALMLGLGFAGVAYFAAGVVFYLAGTALSFYFDRDQLQQGGVLTVILFLVNLVVYSSEKLLPFTDVSLAIYILLLVDLMLLVYLFKRRDGSRWRLPGWPLFAIFLSSIALSALRADHLKEVVYFFAINLGAFALFFSVLNLFSGATDKIIRMVKAMSVLGVVSCVLALWQLYSGSFKYLYYPLIAARDQKILELWEVVSRVVGTWQHPSYLGIYLALIIPATVYLLFYASRSRLEKFWWLSSLTLMCSVLLLTNTRSSVIAGFLGVVLFYLLRNFAGPKVFWKLPDARKIAVLGLAVAAALMLYQFVYVSEIYTKPQAWRVDASATIWGRFMRSDSMSTESLVQRSQLYALALQTFKAHPWFGIGAKNFQYVVESKFKTGTDGHNLLLQTAAETGVVGVVATLLLYAIFIWWLLWQLWHVADERRRYLQAALFAVVLLVLFDSFFNNPLYSLRVLAVFWLVVAFQYGNYRGTSALPGSPATITSHGG